MTLLIIIAVLATFPSVLATSNISGTYTHYVNFTCKPPPYLRLKSLYSLELVYTNKSDSRRSLLDVPLEKYHNISVGDVPPLFRCKGKIYESDAASSFLMASFFLTEDLYGNYSCVTSYEPLEGQDTKKQIHLEIDGLSRNRESEGFRADVRLVYKVKAEWEMDGKSLVTISRDMQNNTIYREELVNCKLEKDKLHCFTFPVVSDYKPHYSSSSGVVTLDFIIIEDARMNYTLNISKCTLGSCSRELYTLPTNCNEHTVSKERIALIVFAVIVLVIFIICILFLLRKKIYCRQSRRNRRGCIMNNRNGDERSPINVNPESNDEEHGESGVQTSLLGEPSLSSLPGQQGHSLSPGSQRNSSSPGRDQRGSAAQQNSSPTGGQIGSDVQQNLSSPARGQIGPGVQQNLSSPTGGQRGSGDEQNSSPTGGQIGPGVQQNSSSLAGDQIGPTVQQNSTSLAGGQIGSEVQRNSSSPAGGQIGPGVQQNSSSLESDQRGSGAQQNSSSTGGQTGPGVQQNSSSPAGGQIGSEVQQNSSSPAGGQIGPGVQQNSSSPEGGQIGPGVQQNSSSLAGDQIGPTVQQNSSSLEGDQRGSGAQQNSSSTGGQIGPGVQQNSSSPAGGRIGPGVQQHSSSPTRGQIGSGVQQNSFSPTVHQRGSSEHQIGLRLTSVQEHIPPVSEQPASGEVDIEVPHK